MINKMSRLPRDLRFYTFAIPVCALAGWGYADSFNTFNTGVKNFGDFMTKTFNNGSGGRGPQIGYDGLVMHPKQSSQPDTTNNQNK